MEQLGIEPMLLLAQIVNFTIIIVVLTKLLYKPILGMLEKRRKEIEEGLKLTEKMKEEDEKGNQKREKMLSEARKEMRRMIEEAKKQAQEEEKEIVALAKAQAEEIVKKGRADVERLHADMRKNLSKEAIVLAVAMSKRLTASLLTEKDQHQLIEKHLKELESMKVGV